MPIMRKLVYYISFLILISITISCIEEFNAGTIEFEDAIVIEASITNELSFQKVLLSRTFRFEENGPQAESGATVQITSSTNMTYTFHETELGVYISDIQFSAQPSVSYQLSVTSGNGRAYTSEPTELTSSSSGIDDIYALRETNLDGVDGIAVYVDSSDPTNSSKYYRYEFEETYKIIAPRWVSDQFIITNLDPFAFTIGPRTQEERVCYNTVKSQGRLIASTYLLSEDRISKFLVKFFPLDDIRNNSRYSIMVKQHTISAPSHRFFETLNNLSSSESLFSQNQPGFLARNIFSTTNPEEKVLGYFDVSSIAQERFFFNRSDYTIERYPWSTCDPYLASSQPVSLAGLIRNNKVSYYAGGMDAPIVLVNRLCGDCTELGSNIKPGFWID